MSPKVLIFSIHGEQSTSTVIDWLDYLGASFIRLNGDQLLQEQCLMQTGGDELVVNSERIDNINSVWYRRTAPQNIEKNTNGIKDEKLKSHVASHMLREKYATINSIYAHFEKKKWLSHPKTSNLNKFHTLTLASMVKLKIPATIITSSKNELIKFKDKHESIIVKNVGDAESFHVNGSNYITYTSIVDQELIENIQEEFFPMMFQERIHKEFEIRVFHLNGINYSMAIFSQNDKQTEVDFRRYNNQKPNRTVPFQLPSDLDSKINRLLSELNLNTASVDLIKSVSGEYFFLEVNPVGQFGMVSVPCNYNLEREIAEYLIN